MTTTHPSASQDLKFKKPIPLVHTTDLYHPPQDPDDQIDLATLLALEEFDLKAIVLDTTQQFLKASPAGFDIPRDPGFVPVAQMGHLLGRDIRVSTSPTLPLKSPIDSASDRAKDEQAGIHMLLEILEDSSEPVVITVVGSARVVTAAFNRNPDLMYAKTRAMILNAGSTGGSKIEWNVGLDPHAFVGLFQSGLPIHWYPCATEKSAFVRQHERGTYWQTTNGALLKNLSPKLQAWFAYGFTGSARTDILEVLNEQDHGTDWKKLLGEDRNLWSTASLVATAGRKLTQTSEGWRFVPHETTETSKVWPWRLDPISAKVSENGKVSWQLSKEKTSTWLFGRKPDFQYAEAMNEALNALLKSMPV